MDRPLNLEGLLTIPTLDHITVDAELYTRYRGSFLFQVFERNHAVTVVPGLCDVNRDATCDVADLDAMRQMIIAGSERQDQLIALVESRRSADRVKVAA